MTTGNLTVGGNTFLNTLSTTGLSSFGGNAIFNGNLTVNGIDTTVKSLSTTKNLTVGGDSLKVTTGNLTVGGDTFLYNLSTTGNVTFGGNVIFNGNLTINSIDTLVKALTTTGNITVRGESLNVTTGNLTVGGNTVLNSLITTGLSSFGGNSIFNGNLTVYGINTKINTLSTSGNLTVNGDYLAVTTGNLTVGGNTFLNTLITTGLSTFGGNAIFNGNVTFPGTISARNLYISNEIRVVGVTTYHSMEKDGTKTFSRRTDGGPITTNDNISCIGQNVEYYDFDSLSKDTLNKENQALTSYEFFRLDDVDHRSLNATKTTSLEGGMIECTDFSFQRNFHMNGNLILNGFFSIDGSSYSATTIKSILDGGSVNSGDFTVSGNFIAAKTATFHGNVIARGNLTVEGLLTCTSQLTLSDYRLKYDIKPINGNSLSFDKLRPVSYFLKNNGTSHLGFLAHELQECIPTAVSGVKDGPEIQAVNYAEIIPVLVRELQELKKEVNILKNQMLSFQSNQVTSFLI